MADLIGSGGSDKDIDKVLVSLKKGAQLFKYGRKGKPKFCPFRLSNDESSLIWISNRGEKELKLATVLRIIPGQRTAVFRRFSCHEKEYLSFSLIYKNGERSLDLICKDKTEAEVWFAGLKALIAAGQGGRSKIDGCGWRQEGILEDGRDLSSNSFSDSSVSASLDISSPESSLFASTSSNRNSAERSTIFDKSDATNMYMKGASSDVLRISTSSAPSSSSHGSGQDDCDSLGDVYIWGEVICDISTRAGSDKYNPSISGKADVLLPRPLEANTVLDVQYVACGVRHAALITRQGEVFTWGEESGGRLGHGFGSDAIHPRLLEPLSASNVDFVSCGEFHTCAVTLAGDLYTWGDGKHYAGVLGHGNDVSHCVPKRVSGTLEGIQVSYVACGTWHTAIITSAGQLFTFGDGTFGVLGHGDRESCAYPREVESLKGLCTLTVACGVWHMAAVVEVIMTQSSASVSSGKLFTWGDGDKYRLGHGDKEPRLKPTCVPSLIDYNFQKVACGHSLTIGLTTQGRIFSMGSTVYGQLGNPLSDGKSPCLVEDKLSSEYVGEVSCGSYHVAVLTTRNEVYTWGKGANGRLGHGDIEDRKMPTLVETLKDRPVKQIACGLNFTAAICPHKWVSGADQSQCSSCRQPFGFTRKRHNCYNCGLVHCHSCSSKKASRAALSPNPAKPYRVCDSCYLKLTKMVESNALNIKRINSPFFAGEKVEAKSTKTSTSSNMDLTMLLDSKTTKHGKKIESMPLIRIPLSLDSNQTFSRAGCQTGTHSLTNSRANSPFSRTLSPPRSITPIPTTSDLSITKTVADSLKETNETLNKQVHQLRAEVESLRKHCELQELELQKSAMRAQEAIQLAAEESAKTKAAKEVMKSLTAQLKDVAERLPAGAYDTDRMNPMYQTDATKIDVNRGAPLRNELLCNAPITPLAKPSGNGTQRLVRTQREHAQANEKGDPLVSWRSGPNAGMEREYSYGIVHVPDRMGLAYVKEADSLPYYSNNSKTRSQSCDTLQTETEWLEQYEPGVYITLVALPDGSRDLKRVRFSRRRFGEHQAESWWSANREKVYEKYNIRAIDKSPTAPPA